jgi:hypothetical protein
MSIEIKRDESGLAYVEIENIPAVTNLHICSPSSDPTILQICVDEDGLGGCCRLTKEQVAELIPLLTAFVQTGSIAGTVEEVTTEHTSARTEPLNLEALLDAVKEHEFTYPNPPTMGYYAPYFPFVPALAPAPMLVEVHPMNSKEYGELLQFWHQKGYEPCYEKQFTHDGLTTNYLVMRSRIQ